MKIRYELINVIDSLTANDGLNFNFASDEDGNYGFLDEDGEFMSFGLRKPLGSKFFKCGDTKLNETVNSINVTPYLVERGIDYTQCTEDNFIYVVVSTRFHTQYGGTSYNGTGYGIKSYDASTGTVTVNSDANVNPGYTRCVCEGYVYYHE